MLALNQWFLTFVTRMLLNCNSQKPQPAQLVVKASGSCSPKLLSNPKLRTSALNHFKKVFLLSSLWGSSSLQKETPTGSNSWVKSSLDPMKLDPRELCPWVRPVTCQITLPLKNLQILGTTHPVRNWNGN